MVEVEAVKTQEGAAIVEALFRKHYGDLYGDLWVFGLQTALRISDLLAIEFDQLDLAKASYEFVEGKTRKRRIVRLNSKALETVNRRRANQPTDVYLFQAHSNRTRSMPPKPINRVTVAKAFKEVGEMPSVDVKLGTHSMRKTRGWLLYKAGVSLEMISKILNHSSPAVTMTYLGITQAEVLATYEDFVI
ncbi:tyrosine-type recombinase/integrase [Halioxenophilus aromaticivorans]|uniref:Site-specific integrase n=1 Tax=Halioxenophilus aromaticivorans TaxID=1306992 RepID=A0AAV3U3T4_9ALTE